jgi:hypothetical protein
MSTAICFLTALFLLGTQVFSLVITLNNQDPEMQCVNYVSMLVAVVGK